MHSTVWCYAWYRCGTGWLSVCGAVLGTDVGWAGSVSGCGAVLGTDVEWAGSLSGLVLCLVQICGVVLSL